MLLRLESVAALLLAALVCPQATQAEAIDDLAQWNMVLLTGDLTSHNDRLKYWFDGHMRLFDDTNGYGQSIVRPAIGWELEDGAGTLWAGWAWIRTSPAAGEDIDEQRFWQQWTWSKDVGDSRVMLRSRLEQRLAEGGDDTAIRYRQFFRVQKKVNDCPTLFLVAWDELFVNLNDADWGPQSGFDQNRVFLGFGFKRQPDSAWRTEVGYMNQAINNAGPVNRVNHILSVNFFH